ncbi:MAG: HD domain-containing protein [Clostridiales bacterium]|nr:HD domain-containing protein [Clostridiales bacterium]
MNMKNITLENVIATNEVFTKLNNLRRWADFTSQQKYNELSKQALNCIIAYVLTCASENAGKKVAYEAFPKIALSRAFAKVYLYYDTPEHKIDEICKLGSVSRKRFDEEIAQIIFEKTNHEFSDFILNGIGEYEKKIYRAATKISTYIEFLEQNKNFMFMDFKDYARVQEIERDLDKYRSLPGVKEFSDTDSPVFRLLQKISTLRNQNRWATSCYNVECSVLGHLFDTAIFAYLFALDDSKFDEQYASKMFFIGIFHDIAETWTRDIPSPVKDRIEGFRKATEEYERKMLEENVYAVIPKYLEKSLREVMLEDEINAAYKKRIKEADYISAESECYRNLLSGSRDPYFAEVIERRKFDHNVTDLCDCVHGHFVEFAKKVM